MCYLAVYMEYFDILVFDYKGDEGCFVGALSWHLYSESKLMASRFVIVIDKQICLFYTPDISTDFVEARFTLTPERNDPNIQWFLLLK